MDREVRLAYLDVGAKALLTATMAAIRATENIIFLLGVL
jgi:hypothetical protein